MGVTCIMSRQCWGITVKDINFETDFAGWSTLKRQGWRIFLRMWCSMYKVSNVGMKRVNSKYKHMEYKRLLFTFIKGYFCYIKKQNEIH